MAQQVKVHIVQPHTLGPILWKEVTDSYKLSSDFYMCAKACMDTEIHAHMYTHTLTQINLFNLS